MRRTNISRLTLSVSMAILCLLFVGTGQGAPLTLSGVLSGLNENPTTSSLGTGFAVVTIDPVAHTMIVDVAFSNLVTTGTGTTASHIHCCVAAPGNAGVATTTPTFPGFPLGVTAGTYHHAFDLTLASSYNPAFVTAQGSVAAAEAALEAGFIAGQTYLNVHSSAFPGGEVRAFLTPEPATLGLGLVGLAAFWLGRRRRI